MENEVFRKKSLDKMKSPENLSDYIKVANPGVWMVLLAALTLLIGALIWGCFGHIDTKFEAVAITSDGQTVCFVDEEYIDSLQPGMKVDINGEEGTILLIGPMEESLGKHAVLVDANVPDGSYMANIIIESIKPLSFVFN